MISSVSLHGAGKVKEKEFVEMQHNLLAVCFICLTSWTAMGNDQHFHSPKTAMTKTVTTSPKWPHGQAKMATLQINTIYHSKCYF